MQLRPIEIEVPEDDPFKFDVLGRKELEPTLTAFISLAEGSLVMALDGPWGSGKTTFLRMWKGCLQKQGHACVYLNAWTSDFAADPLVPLVAELSDQVETQIPTLKDHLDKVRKLGASILKRSVPIVLQLATAGLLKAEELTETKLGELAGQIAEDQIKSYEEAKSSAERFRSALGKIGQKVAETDAGSKIVVIIDELDRCRPTYAVELLERMKHLFNVEGVTFVLGIDRAQLGHSIKALYGSDFDATGYLKRFIDIDYRLPAPEPGRYCVYLLEKLGVNTLLQKRVSQDRDSFQIDLMKEMISVTGLSLRQQDQVLGRLRVVLQTVPERHRLHASVLSFLLVIREWRSDFYAAIEGGTPDVEAILAALENRRRPREQDNEHFWNLIEATALYIGLVLTRCQPQRLQRYKEMAQESTSDIGRRPGRVLNLVEALGHFAEESSVRTSLERLALTRSFVLDPEQPR